MNCRRPPGCRWCRDGCGVAEASLHLAAQGYTVVGVDVTPTAVAAATAAATERGLTTATYLQADITSFTGYDGRFSTVLDSTLFHSLPVAMREDYLRAVHRAAAPGASYFVLVFASCAFPPDAQTTPNEVTEDALREAVSKYWQIDEIRPAFIHVGAAVLQIPGMPVPSPYSVDDNGRQKMPAFLLTAHKVS